MDALRLRALLLSGMEHCGAGPSPSQRAQALRRMPDGMDSKFGLRSGRIPAGGVASRPPAFLQAKQFFTSKWTAQWAPLQPWCVVTTFKESLA